MSGGAFEGQWYSWGLAEVAERIGRENPVFGKLLKDVNNLIGRYDYFISGDIGEETIKGEWRQFREKWLQSPPDGLVSQIIREETEALVKSIEDGYDSRPKFWED